MATTPTASLGFPLTVNTLVSVLGNSRLSSFCSLAPLDMQLVLTVLFKTLHVKRSWTHHWVKFRALLILATFLILVSPSQETIAALPV